MRSGAIALTVALLSCTAPAAGPSPATSSPTQPAATSPAVTPSPSPTVTSDAPTEEDARSMAALTRFARSPGPDAHAEIPFAGEVRLGLADELLVRRSSSELARPEAWVLDVEVFRAYAGPFSALDVLARPGETTVSVGPHPHCASPPVPPPPEVARLRRVSVQPELGPNDSCLNWWTVDAFVTADGEIAAVTLDLWEP